MDGPTPAQGNKASGSATVRRRQAALFAGVVILAAGAGVAVGSATGATPAHASHQHLATSTTVKVAAVTIITVNDPPKVPALRHVVTHTTTTTETTASSTPSYTTTPATSTQSYTAPRHKHAVLHAIYRALHPSPPALRRRLALAYAEPVTVALAGPDAFVAHDHPNG